MTARRTKPKYELSARAALKVMRGELEKMQAEKDREQLKGVDPDTAFEKGYAAAIRDFDVLVGPDPRAVLAQIEGQTDLLELLDQR